MTITQKREANHNIQTDRAIRISLNTNTRHGNCINDYLSDKHLKILTKYFIRLIINRSRLLTGKKETENLCKNSRITIRDFNYYTLDNSLFSDINRLLSIIINGKSDILKIMLNNLTGEIYIQHLFPILTKRNRSFFLSFKY